MARGEQRLIYGGDQAIGLDRLYIKPIEAQPPEGAFGQAIGFFRHGDDRGFVALTAGDADLLEGVIGILTEQGEIEQHDIDIMAAEIMHPFAAAGAEDQFGMDLFDRRFHPFLHGLGVLDAEDFERVDTVNQMLHDIQL